MRAAAQRAAAIAAFAVACYDAGRFVVENAYVVEHSSSTRSSASASWSAGRDAAALQAVESLLKKSKALLLYPLTTADHNGAFNRTHAARRVGAFDGATLVRVTRVAAARRWLKARTAPASLTHVSLAGHGNGSRIKWGDGACHHSDRRCGLFPGVSPRPVDGLWPGATVDGRLSGYAGAPPRPVDDFWAVLSTRLAPRAVVTLESCYSDEQVGPAVSELLPPGVRVFAPSGCYRPEALTFRDGGRGLVPALAGGAVRRTAG